uniref:SH2 domain-containing protein n=1 Tax=Parastrongyloides trichosuri TaxID=131310 RepID=A0A0N4Z4Z2_PARTI
MGLLQDILEKMYVEPELLAALDEEQKQVLFRRMREEQVRRYNENEILYEKLLKEGVIKKDPSSRRVQWKNREDGDVYTFIFDEDEPERKLHEDEDSRDHDINIHEKELMFDKLLKFNNNESENLNEEQLKKQLGEMEISPEFVKEYNPQNQFSVQTASQLFFSKPNLNGKVAAAKIAFENSPKQSQHSLLYDNTQLIHGTNAINNDPTIMVQKNNKISNIPIQEIPTKSSSLYESNSVGINSVGVKDLLSQFENIPYQNGHSKPIVNNPPTPVPPQIILQSYPVPNGNIDISNTTSIVANAKAKLNILEPEMKKRQNIILEKLNDERKRVRDNSFSDNDKHYKDSNDQDTSLKQAEQKIREIAIKAREAHRKQELRTSSPLLNIGNGFDKAMTFKEAIKKIPRPPKPESRNAIIKWFKEKEIPAGTGIDPITERPSIWFHGIISRDAAEKLLAKTKCGSFLVRVSERIWGYTVSYSFGDGTFKHFLIEKINQGYQFLGTNQIVHYSLYDLIQHHLNFPVTTSGNEILKYPIGQSGKTPDYLDLFSGI